MSLLLEALKKAEKAKEEAQRRAGAEGEPAAAPAPLLTRDRLPDISAPLEIVSDDLEPRRATAEAPTLEPLAPPAKPARPAPAAAANAPGRRAAPAADEAGRSTARKVFEAKFREPNPRMPFYITLGVLGAFALGTIGYFWYQLRPPSPLVNLNARPADTALAAAPAVAAPAAVPASPAREAPIPGLPGEAQPVAAAPVPSTPAPSAPQAQPQRRPEEPKLAPRLAPRLAPPAVPAAQPVTTVSRTVAQVNPNVEAGYTAYEAGDLGKARADYEQALRDEPANRDALLGLAALDVRAGRYETAEALYLRALQADPRDAQAQAALLSLRAGRSDPLATESRVKSLLAAEPGAHALNFTLGNQLAQQNRWDEAHPQYLKAYAAEPDNADFAYNVAVSLDHLHRSREALDYYQRAIALARARGASFDVAAAQARAAQLGR